jgi:hypothetical protein
MMHFFCAHDRYHDVLRLLTDVQSFHKEMLNLRPLVVMEVINE